MAQAQRRCDQDSLAFKRHFLQAECVPSAAQPLSLGAGVSPLLVFEVVSSLIIFPCLSIL